MVALIISTHGKLSEELVKSAEMIYCSQKNVSAISFTPGESLDSLLEKYNNIINNLDCTDGILFMVDLLGGRPFNAANILALENDDIKIITGVNLPMLLEVFGNRDSLSLPELTSMAINSGKNSIKQLLQESNY